MKIYRVNKFDRNMESHGFEFKSSKAEAKKARTKFVNSLGSNDTQEDEYECEIETIEINLTKAGVIELLNKVAGHNDNG